MVELTFEEKGALLLNHLAPQVVNKILARLPPERRSRLRILMENIKQRPEAQGALAALIEELNGRMAEGAGHADQTSPPTGPPIARGVDGANRGGAVPKAVGTTSEVADTPAVLSAEPDPRIALAALAPDRLARVLAEEGSRTASLVLSLLDITQAGAVYKLLGPDLRNEVSVQFSSQKMPSLAIVRRLVQAVADKCTHLSGQPKLTSDTPRPRQMADLLRVLSKPDRLKVLENLESKTPEVAAEVKNLLYRFEDVLRIENRSMQKVLTETDARSLAVALKDAADNLKEKFLTNLSKRAQENLREEMEILQSVPKDQVEQAQQAIVTVIQRLDLAGELAMSD